MAVIGDKTFSQIQEHIKDLCEAYAGPIDDAYIKQEKAMKICFTVSLSPGDGSDDVDVKTSMSFSKGRVKDCVKGTANERQGTLFEGEKA